MINADSLLCHVLIIHQVVQYTAQYFRYLVYYPQKYCILSTAHPHVTVQHITYFYSLKKYNV
jgi:hypothetical protein